VAKPKDTSVTAIELADWLGLTPRTVLHHATTGIVKRASKGQYFLKASVQSYTAHQRKAATGRAATPRTDERARLNREQADAVAHKNAVTRGEYEKSADVETRWCGILRSVRSGCLALSTRIGAQIAHLTAHDIAVIDREVRAVLTELGDPDGNSPRQD
jgi:phage terminase Nu1 subunit (DNA packaging protein)